MRKPITYKHADCYNNGGSVFKAPSSPNTFLSPDLETKTVPEFSKPDLSWLVFERSRKCFNNFKDSAYVGQALPAPEQRFVSRTGHWGFQGILLPFHESP
jgi:hypothetical protein